MTPVQYRLGRRKVSDPFMDLLHPPAYEYVLQGLFEREDWHSGLDYSIYGTEWRDLETAELGD